MMIYQYCTLIHIWLSPLPLVCEHEQEKDSACIPFHTWTIWNMYQGHKFIDEFVLRALAFKS